MEPDPEKRIADLERQVAEQKRIADLERQLADAKAAAGQESYGEQPAGPDMSRLRESLSQSATQAGLSQAQLDQALQHGGMTVTTGRSFVSPGQTPPTTDRPRRGLLSGANGLGVIGGVIGGCIGGAAALTAILPSSALWTSAVVCGAPDQLMINTSHYSYKPGQSGTSIGFQCLAADGAHDASFLAITALQMLVVAIVLGAALLAIGTWRRSRNQSVGAQRMIITGGFGLIALIVVGAIGWQVIGNSSAPIQMPQGGNLTIHGNGEMKTVACNGGHLTITGRDETVTVTGHCAQISVDGVIHHVTVDSVDVINMAGVNNVLTYHSGTPTINRKGGQNQVQQG